MDSLLMGGKVIIAKSAHSCYDGRAVGLLIRFSLFFGADLVSD